MTISVKGRRVARTTIRRNGTFSARARLSRRMASRPRLPLQARAGRARSGKAPLATRVRVTTVRSKGARVIIAGRVTGPIPRRAAKVAVVRQAGCGRGVVVKRFRPKPSGRFRVALSRNAAGREPSVVRLRTRVPRRAVGGRTVGMTSLPRAVHKRTG